LTLRSPRFRRLGLPLVLLAVALGLHGPAAWARDAESADGKLYQGLLPSTVWINLVKKSDPSGKTEFLSGTGALIDARKGLVLTNRHVVRDKEDAYVLFPAFPLGHLRRDRPFYTEQIFRGIQGKVIARDAAHDLALIQLAWVPPGAKAVRLAEKHVNVGDHIFSLGNPGDSDQLWVFRAGAVQRRLHEKFHSKTGDGFESEVDADILLTDSVNRPGESGGPLINERGELAGVIHGDRTVKLGNKETHYGLFIDLSDVRAFLDSRKVATTRPAVPAPTASASTHVKAPAEAPRAKAPEEPEDPESTAARRLKLARSLVTDGKADRAAERLREIIKHFPKTKAAGEAQELLDQLSK
jgi:hypothetical protein